MLEDSRILTCFIFTLLLLGAGLFTPENEPGEPVSRLLAMTSTSFPYTAKLFELSSPRNQLHMQAKITVLRKQRETAVRPYCSKQSFVCIRAAARRYQEHDCGTKHSRVDSRSQLYQNGNLTDTNRSTSLTTHICCLDAEFWFKPLITSAKLLDGPCSSVAPSVVPLVLLQEELCTMWFR